MTFDYDHSYFDQSDEEPKCAICRDNEQRIDEAGAWLNHVMDHLYGQKNLNRFELERDLEELCHLLRVKIRGGDLMI